MQLDPQPQTLHMSILLRVVKGLIVECKMQCVSLSNEREDSINKSVRRQLNLAWKLSLVIKNLSRPSLLDSVTEERVPVIAEMLRRTTGMHTHATSKPVDLSDDALKMPAGKGAEVPPWLRGGALFMLEINYRWSSIVLEERTRSSATKDEMKMHAYGGYEGDVLCAGDRAPEAPGLVVKRTATEGEETTLFKLLDYTKHTVLIFAPKSQLAIADNVRDASASLRQFAAAAHIFAVSPSRLDSVQLDERWAQLVHVLFDRDGHAHVAYGVKDVALTFVVIRPDMYIGAITNDVAGVQRYFERVLIV